MMHARLRDMLALRREKAKEVVGSEEVASKRRAVEGFPRLESASEVTGARAIFDMLRQSKGEKIDKKQLSGFMSTFGVGNNPGLVSDVLLTLNDDESDETLDFEGFAPFVAMLRLVEDEDSAVDAEVRLAIEAAHGETSIESVVQKLRTSETVAERPESIDAYLTKKNERARHQDRMLRIARTTVLHACRASELSLDDAASLARDVRGALSWKKRSDASAAALDVAEAESRAAVQIELDAMLLDATRSSKLGEFKDARKIIARGANVNLRRDEPPREPVLSKAISEANFDMAVALLDAGADARATDDDGATGLMRLVATPAPSLKLINRLVAESGINTRKHDGATALVVAATFGRTLAMTQLIDQGADVSLVMTDGTTALMRAAQMGFPAAVDILCQAGADPHATNQAGRNALDLALLADRSERVVERLKHQGARASKGALTSKNQIDRRRTNSIRPPETTARRKDATSPLARLRKPQPGSRRYT
ncbi:hypothetical protein CTAYLR_001829 [Chrysophaeum taylorii]|uniref:Uncharacterized protein n=1 Tax=Chrysophaeum taylorii TaxID=2483200 RepID=A0AAD7U8Z5_9STRA|nr:hypothetical protein CTAYLR_001829 [Chrysophaeum taylorii]